MRQNLRPIAPEAEAIVLAAEVVAAMITVDTRDNRASPAGSPFRTQRAGDVTERARRPRLKTRRYVCQEADQRLQNARRNRHGNRDKETRQSGRICENRTSRRPTAWMKWPNCANMLQHKPRYSKSVRKKLTLLKSQPPMPESASDFECKSCSRVPRQRIDTDRNNLVWEEKGWRKFDCKKASLWRMRSVDSNARFSLKTLLKR